MTLTHKGGVWVAMLLFNVACWAMALTGCSSSEGPSKPPESSATRICRIGENIEGVHRQFTCAEINAQPDCPRCSG